MPYLYNTRYSNLNKLIKFKAYMMLVYLIRIKLFLCFIAILSCSSPMSQIDTFQKELLSEVEEILCPNIKFIEGLDRITITNQKSDLYKLKFHEVKWKCYSNIISSNEITDNIDLDIIFKVDYIEDTSNFQSETFNFIVVLLDENSKIISKEKFNRSFLSKSKSEIIKNKEGLINIVVKNSQDQIYNYQLLLGLIKDEKN